MFERMPDVSHFVSTNHQSFNINLTIAVFLVHFLWYCVITFAHPLITSRAAVMMNRVVLRNALKLMLYKLVSVNMDSWVECVDGICGGI